MPRLDRVLPRSGIRSSMPMAPGDSPVLVISHAAFPANRSHSGRHEAPSVPMAARTLGLSAGRRRPYRAGSIVNLAAPQESEGSSAVADALARAASLAGCMYSTATPSGRPLTDSGGALLFQITPDYSGCQTPNGQFNLARLLELVDARADIRAIEIVFRGAGARHAAFADTDALLDLLELLASTTGLPVGIRSPVGDLGFWRELSRLVDTTDRSVDFITIEGSEAHHANGSWHGAQTCLPFALGLSRVQHLFASRQQHDRIVFIGEGRLGRPDAALMAFALGCDMVNLGREAIASLGVADEQGLDRAGYVSDANVARLAADVAALRNDLMALAVSCGVTHPSEVDAAQMEWLDRPWRARPLSDLFGGRGVGLPASGEPAAAGPSAHLPGAAAPLVFRRR
jgi:hypothetical protein